MCIIVEDNKTCEKDMLQTGLEIILETTVLYMKRCVWRVNTDITLIYVTTKLLGTRPGLNLRLRSQTVAIFS